MNCVLTADIGSTFTKLRAIDLSGARVIAAAQSPTTAAANAALADAAEGFYAALGEIHAQCGKLNFSHMLAASSAAGGLKMISVGLVPGLSSNAAKMAAASAGAKVLKSYSYELSQAELDGITALKPDIILLSGGTDGGNKEVIIENAKAVAQIKQDILVIIAGNKSASAQAAGAITASGKKAVITENVMPEYGRVNVGPAKEAIRTLFIERIIHARGLDKIQSFLTEKIIPTPLAVFNALSLLSKGIENIAEGMPQYAGLGALMAFDIGGATTDVYSMADGTPQKPNITLKGLIEPYAKRTVEADIGMRHSLRFLAEEAGFENILARLNIPEKELNGWLDMCEDNPEAIPEPGGTRSMIDTELAACAVDISADRHCGVIESVYTPMGEAFIQTGKDLSGVKLIIGSGGMIINSPHSKEILSRAFCSSAKPAVLRPREADILLDSHNILAHAGLVSGIYPAAALDLMKKNIKNHT